MTRRLEKCEATFKPKSEYNRHLFTLYCKYLRRYRLTVRHAHQLKYFMDILESRDLFAFRSWGEILNESEAFKATFGKKRNSGCPFIKIGRMLEEVGAIEFRQRSVEKYLSRIDTIPAEQRKYIGPFITFLKSTSRSGNTLTITTEILKSFSSWLSEHGCQDLMTVNSDHLRSFIDETKAKNVSQGRIVQIYFVLNKFYKWSICKKHTLINPCASIKVTKPSPRLSICSDEQCRALFDFVRNENSPPEEALIIALILIWALKSEELRYATLEFGDGLTIAFYRHKLTFKKHYDRDQILKLPNQPKWFHKLQIKYYKYWIEQYKVLQKSAPHYYLLLPSRRNVQPITKTTLKSRILKATKSATGEEIPPRVLRKTSGYLHSLQGDASILSTLGWSTEYCFKYTWVPKIVYQKKPPVAQ